VEGGEVKLLIIIIAFSISGCDAPTPSEEQQLKTLAQECINICPSGVSSFRITYKDSECRCK